MKTSGDVSAHLGCGSGVGVLPLPLCGAPHGILQWGDTTGTVVWDLICCNTSAIISACRDMVVLKDVTSASSDSILVFSWSMELVNVD